MSDPDTTTLVGYLSAIATAITAGGFTLRKYLRNEKVSDASNSSVVKGYQGNDAVVGNLIAEVARLSSRLTELEGKVEHLTDKLASVRLIALDCYQLANECDCMGESKQRLLTHLKQIIKDA